MLQDVARIREGRNFSFLRGGHFEPKCHLEFLDTFSHNCGKPGKSNTMCDVFGALHLARQYEYACK